MSRHRSRRSRRLLRGCEQKHGNTYERAVVTRTHGTVRTVCTEWHIIASNLRSTRLAEVVSSELPIGRRRSHGAPRRNVYQRPGQGVLAGGCAF